MTIFGKRLTENVAFCKLFLGLIIVVGILRLALSLGGAPTSIAKWLSITAVAWIGVLYYAIRVHTTVRNQEAHRQTYGHERRSACVTGNIL
jgi:hypothetical protein